MNSPVLCSAALAGNYLRKRIVSAEASANTVLKEIVNHLNITEGKALILFTAKDDMQYVFKKLSNMSLPYKIASSITEPISGV
ncbi:hypothetical protein [Ruminococcus sp.]|uniref:hypothetical protein n=1 Tax=Ruminococcus sp. TaxID=41978 RepID=UPI0025F100A6|nr:hypothetical protein [Ruminococcus sp.]MBR1431345.1 hypothetical protein [Ruminococcus sp.]